LDSISKSLGSNTKVEKKTLGQTGLNVSRLCFGTLTLSPLQRNLSVEAGAKLIEKAVDQGINFFDTAELYQNYPYLRKAFEKRDDVVIATKSYSYDQKTAEKSLEAARRGLNRDVIDIFLLHEQESDLTLKGHWEAIEYFVRQKQLGRIKAFGISTHHIAGIKAANQYDEIEVIHMIYNLTGIGIADGSLEAMETEIKTAHRLGKGCYAMKPLGGGHLIDRREDALKFVLNQSAIDSVAIGIQSEAELAYNLSFFGGHTPGEKICNEIRTQKRYLHIHTDWCTGCGACVERCGQDALRLIHQKATVNNEKCVLCSYCASVCPVLAIKII